VVFRTLDIGADKVLPYLRQPKEDNPAMGWRSIRMALDRPALLRLQIRALLMAGAGKPMKIMFPMIADVEEYRRAMEAVEAEKIYLTARGHELPAKLLLGVMIEIPSLIWQLDQLLPLVDFASIGSNDLVQFLFASDRSNPRLAGRYDPLSPSALGAMRLIVEKAARHAKPVTLCGELGGRPLEAMGLVGIGLTSISMVPSAVGPVKAMILSLDRGKLWAFMKPLLESPMHSIRPELLEFAQRNGVVL
jgi:phosphotransferase system enzyme I (PtsP)